MAFASFKEKRLSTDSKGNDLTQSILEFINEKHPQSVKELVTALKESLNLQESEIIETVKKMENDGLITLQNNYQDSSRTWYLLTIAIGIFVVVLVLLVPVNLYPWFYARNFFGLLFVFFLPGYAFTKAVFPIAVHNESETLEVIEKTALSFAVSIALVSIVGLILYYSPLQFNLNTSVVGLFVITSSFATVGLLRENNVTKKKTYLDELPVLE